MESVKIGDRAPGFSLPSETGETVDIGDYIGRKTSSLIFLSQGQYRRVHERGVRLQGQLRRVQEY